MSFLTSFVTTKAKNLHDAAIKTVASWDPDTVAESQIAEWQNQAQELANSAAKAATDAKTANDAVENIKANVSRYTAAAEKLATSNPDAANKAADQALELSSRLEAAQAEAADATAWANETLVAAQNAQKLVLEGRTKVEAAKRDQARAQQEAVIAERRRADRERMAGVVNGLNGTDVAIDALKANANAARQKAAANNIRSEVLGKSTDSDSAINAALAEVDNGGVAKPTSLADKLAALKAKN